MLIGLKPFALTSEQVGVHLPSRVVTSPQSRLACPVDVAKVIRILEPYKFGLKYLFAYYYLRTYEVFSFFVLLLLAKALIG